MSLNACRAGERLRAPRLPQAGSDRQIGRALGERVVHLPQNQLIVLEIAVDHRDEVGAR